MNKNILLRTNLMICIIIVVGFLLTSVLSYHANYSASLQNIEEVSKLTSEGIYYQLTSTFTKPVNISLTIANDSLLRTLLIEEPQRQNDPDYINTVKEYLNTYRQKYDYDSVFLVSTATNRYYNFNGMDRVLLPNNPENDWYFGMLHTDTEYWMNVDNDEVENAANQITVFVNCKIKDNSGKLLGMVGVGLSIDNLQSLLQTYRSEFGVDSYLVDEAGIIQISPQHSGYEKVSLFDTIPYGDAIRQQILDWKEEGMQHSFWAGAQISGADQDFIVTRFLPELGWHLVVNQDTSAMVGELNRQLFLTILIILAIIAIILLVITYVIRSFNKRIITLTQAVEYERRSIFKKATEQLFDKIYELDITNNRPANLETEQYFQSQGVPPDMPFDQALHIIAKNQIKEEYRQGYIDTFSTENVKKVFAAGQETLRYDFMISNGGDYYWMRITARIVRWGSDGSIHMLTYRQNIDKEKRQEHRMQLLAQTDEMTGLLTKTATRQYIEKMLSEYPENQYAFMIFDIDKFKRANDQFGHAFGDTVIVEFADRIKSNLNSECITGRIGGDEFVAFVPIDNREFILKKVEELSNVLNYQHMKDESVWNVTASIGISLAPDNGSDFETLYTKADDALYQTKENGRNSYTFYRD